jgi:glucose/mannose transport system permease protein
MKSPAQPTDSRDPRPAAAVLQPAFAARTKAPHKRRFSEYLLSPIILSPTMILVLIFVYVFIAVTVWVSLSNWHTLKVDMTLREPFGATYQQMFAMPRWHANLRNVFIFTVFFLTLAIGLGLSLALLLDRKLIGYAFLRNVFLFPYSLSFIVTGIAWRWVFNPETGINVLIDTLGI